MTARIGLALMVLGGCDRAAADAGRPDAGRGGCTVVHEGQPDVVSRYDAEGRLVAMASTDWSMGWSWRADGQPLEFVERTAAGVKRTSTRYDVDGHMVETRYYADDVLRAVKVFDYDGDVLVREGLDADLDGEVDAWTAPADDPVRPAVLAPPPACR